MKYVVLLRGVNAGGKRRVPNAEFKAALESLGFQDVVIYINSGNAVFASEHTPDTESVRATLEKRFGFDIPTLILSAEKIKTIAAALPPEWGNDPLRPDKSGQKSDVLYLFDDINTPDILEKIGYRPDIETFIYIDGAVLTNISRKNQLQGSLQKLIGTKLYGRMTLRNSNTARKLAALV